MGSAVNAPDILRHPTLYSGLISFFPFEGNANDAKDGHNGTVSGATQVVGTRYNKLAYSFNGSSYYITLGTHADFEAVNIAISAWVYPTATTVSKKVVAKRNDVTIQWALQVNSTNPRWEFTIKIAGSVYTVTNTVNFLSNNWYHLVGTYDGTKVRLYVNGLEVGTAVTITGSISSSATMPVLFGARCANGSTSPGADYFGGTIDEPGIWSRGLTEDEVRDLYYGGNGLTFDTTVKGAVVLPLRDFTYPDPLSGTQMIWAAGMTKNFFEVSQRLYQEMGQIQVMLREPSPTFGTPNGLWGGTMHLFTDVSRRLSQDMGMVNFPRLTAPDALTQKSLVFKNSIFATREVTRRFELMYGQVVLLRPKRHR